MDSSDVIKTIVKAVAENSAEILTAFGVTGVISTSYLAGKASYEARDVIIRSEFYNEDGTVRDEPVQLTLKEKFKKTWKLYIPATASGVMSVTCVIMSNRASSKRTAAMVTAYSLSERAYSEYREMVAESIGEKKEQKIRDEIAQRTVNNNPPTREIMMLGKGKILCCDLYTRRYFQSTMEDLKRCENKINQLLNNGDYAALDDWYDMIGLDYTSESGKVGWKIEKGLMEIEMSQVAVYSPEGEPCAAYTFNYLTPL